MRFFLSSPFAFVLSVESCITKQGNALPFIFKSSKHATGSLMRGPSSGDRAKPITMRARFGFRSELLEERTWRSVRKMPSLESRWAEMLQLASASKTLPSLYRVIRAAAFFTAIPANERRTGGKQGPESKTTA